MKKSETEKQMDYRLIIGEYGIQLKIDTLKRVLDERESLRAQLKARDKELAESKKKYDGLSRYTDIAEDENVRLKDDLGSSQEDVRTLKSKIEEVERD